MFQKHFIVIRYTTHHNVTLFNELSVITQWDWKMTSLMRKLIIHSNMHSTHTPVNKCTSQMHIQTLLNTSPHGSRLRNEEMWHTVCGIAMYIQYITLHFCELYTHIMYYNIISLTKMVQHHISKVGAFGTVKFGQDGPPYTLTTANILKFLACKSAH